MKTFPVSYTTQGVTYGTQKKFKHVRPQEYALPHFVGFQYLSGWMFPIYIRVCASNITFPKYTHPMGKLAPNEKHRATTKAISAYNT